jgi:4-hydroxy-4-methyl-2-oxoglutarate aldolase
MNHISGNGRPINTLDALCRYDTCTVANAIERFNVRPRNEGFVSGTAFCRFPNLAPVAGHAVTGRIQTYMPPMTGKCYYENVAWWEYLATIPAPRIMVLQDFDNRPGFGAIFGEVHARLCRAFGCVAYVTNGSVRDLGGVEPVGIQLFAGSVSVSHSYAHIVDFGEPVEIGGLSIKPGDILHGDRHGVLTVPQELVERLPDAAERIRNEESELFALIESPEFSVETLGAKLRAFAEKQACS